MLDDMYTGRWHNGNFLIRYARLHTNMCRTRVYLWDIEAVVKDNPNRVSIWDYDTVVQLYKDKPDLVVQMVDDLERRFKQSWWPTPRLAYKATRSMSICMRLLVLQLTRDWMHQVPSWDFWSIRTRTLSRREWRKWLRTLPEKSQELK